MPDLNAFTIRVCNEYGCGTAKIYGYNCIRRRPLIKRKKEIDKKKQKRLLQN
jgi:hypothetical protein